MFATSLRVSLPGPRMRQAFALAPHAVGRRDARSLFGFSWFGTDKKVNETPSKQQQVPTPIAQNATPHTASTASTKPTESSDRTKATVAKASVLAARDEEIKRKLLDMDGGNAGFEFEGGKPAGGQGPETRRNFFRIM